MEVDLNARSAQIKHLILSMENFDRKKQSNSMARGPARLGSIKKMSGPVRPGSLSPSLIPCMRFSGIIEDEQFPRPTLYKSMNIVIFWK